MQTFSPLLLLLLHLVVYGLAMAILAPGAGIWALALLVPLVWASLVDVQRFEIPDLASALLVVSGVVWLAVRPPDAPKLHVVGGLIWPLLFFAVAWSYTWLRGRTGLGLGDVKLMAGIGLWCGSLGTILVVLGATLAGLFALVLHAAVTGRSNLTQSKLAFGPFLCLFAWCIWLAGRS